MMSTLNGDDQKHGIDEKFSPLNYLVSGSDVSMNSGTPATGKSLKAQNQH